MYSSVVVYLVDTKKVPYYNEMFDLVDPCTVIFFYQKKVGSCNERTQRYAPVTLCNLM